MRYIVSILRMSSQIAQPIPYARAALRGLRKPDALSGARTSCIVSSLYDSFILREDGQLNELLIGDSLELHLQHIPNITHVSSGKEALAQVQVRAALQSDRRQSRTGRHECRAARAAVKQAGLMFRWWCWRTTTAR